MSANEIIVWPAPAHAARAGARSEDFGATINPRFEHDTRRFHARERGETPGGESLDSYRRRRIPTASSTSMRPYVIRPTRRACGPAYDFDGVHLNDAGYDAMANAINLSMLF